MEYKINENFKIINDNSKLMLKYLKENSIDSIVCDPPYELGFMNKKWDGTGIAYDVEFWEQCLKVLKPGGYLLAFGGSRTYHRMACAIEDAGFELRDTIMWLYGSGFPKSQNVGVMVDKKLGNESKVVGNGKSGKTSRAYQSEETTTAGAYEIKQAQNEWAGYGTCLKPAFEPIIMARKPLDGSVADNILKYGVGAINIDECRVDNVLHEEIGRNNIKGPYTSGITMHLSNTPPINSTGRTNLGRFPANVITDGSEEVASGMPYTKSEGGCKRQNSESMFGMKQMKDDFNFHDEGFAMRYFYCAKASKKDRDEGLDSFESKEMFVADNEHGNLGAFYVKKAGGQLGDKQLRKNIHPTVKPTELMQYLVRLVSPKGATILDPFNGSGSTGKAVAFENRERNANYKYIGFELEKEYIDISIARINFALNQYEYEAEKEERETGQMRLF